VRKVQKNKEIDVGKGLVGEERGRNGVGKGEEIKGQGVGWREGLWGRGWHGGGRK